MKPTSTRFAGFHRFGAALLASLMLAALLPGAVFAVAPVAPSTPDLAPASDTGSSNTDNIT